jgi:hypothetical protein
VPNLLAGAQFESSLAIRFETRGFHKAGIASDGQEISNELSIFVAHDSFLKSRLLIDELNHKSRRHGARGVPNDTVDICGRSLGTDDFFGCEQNSDR